MIGTKKFKWTEKMIISWVIILMLLSPMTMVQTYGQSMPQIEFKNVTGDGKDIISLTDQRTFEAVVFTEEQISPKEVVWTLSREKGMQDGTIFPYQYLGGPLQDWTLWNQQEPYFTGITTEAIEVNGKSALKLTFSTEYFFGTNRADSPRGHRNVVLDYTGDYILSCKDASENILGQTSVRVNSYDDYRTNSEFEKELMEAKQKADAIDGLYMEVLSMGTSTQGYDMPYAVISDSKDAIEAYHQQNKLALEDPEAVIRKIKEGNLDYKIPILYSNIHADETPGADAPMNFIWHLINSFEDEGEITYNILTGFTAKGKKQLKLEIEEAGIHWSKLIQDYVTGLGFIKAGNTVSGPVDLEKYYTMENYTLDVNQLLDHIIFIIVPTENTDGRVNNIRQNGN